MRDYSLAMAGMGLLICVLTVSAALAGAKVPAAVPGGTAAEDAAVPVALIELPPDSPVGQACSAESGLSASVESRPETQSSVIPEAQFSTEPAGPFLVALRIGRNVPDRVFLGDRWGSPLEPVEPDTEGEAALGPVPPGTYTLVVGTQELGSFLLLDNAALDGASGQLWTDGEVLHLENYEPGTAEVDLVLSAPGLYSLCLQGGGGEYRADLFVSKRERPNSAESWHRTVCFPGLPAGSYRLFLDETLLTDLIVRAGSVSEVSAGR